MDTLITIKPIDIEHFCELRKDTTRIPGTKRKFQIDNDVADKFRSFDKVKKGVISSEELYSMKPELIISFPKYEEKISLETAIKRLAESNALISEKYGRKDLRVTKEQLDKVLSNELMNISDKTNNVVSLKEQLLKKDNRITELEEEIKNLKRKEIVYTTVISEYEDQQVLDEDIKLIA